MSKISGTLPDGTQLDLDLPDGWGRQPVFGERELVPVNSEADVWGGASLERPLPLAPKPMFIVSDNVADAFPAGAGAQIALVTFIDDLGDWRQSDLLLMNGTTNVAITHKPDDGIFGSVSNPPRSPSPPDGTSEVAQIFRIQDVLVLVAGGATEAAPHASNTGEITVVDGGAVVFDVVPAGAGRATTAAFHCPRRHEARLTYVDVGTFGGQISAYISTNFGLGTATQNLPIIATASANAAFDADAAITPVAERADVHGTVKTQSNNVTVTFLMQFRLKSL